MKLFESTDRDEAHAKQAAALKDYPASECRERVEGSTIYYEVWSGPEKRVIKEFQAPEKPTVTTWQMSEEDFDKLADKLADRILARLKAGDS